MLAKANKIITAIYFLSNAGFHIIILRMSFTNIYDYINWRGDLSFEQDPFNAMDALLFACISYVDFNGIIPEEGSITMEEATDVYFQIHTQEEIEADKSFTRFSYLLMREASHKDRYRNLTISDFVDCTSMEDLIQFAVLTIRTAPDEVFIAFRGTDDTIVGWKEDFYMSCSTISSEKEALEYLIRTQAGKNDRIRLGGHSKGGHLSIYCSYRADEEIQNRIEKIYDLDGPGFNKEVKNSERFQRIGSKIERYIPENSVIGRLLADTAEPVVVVSSEKGLMQHDPVSWGIIGKEFVTVAKPSLASDVFDDTLTKWIDDMDFESKRQFIDDLFAVLEASGETNISQFSQLGLIQVKAMLDRMHSLQRESQLKIKVLLRLFIDNWGVALVIAKPQFKKLIDSKK